MGKTTDFFLNILDRFDLVFLAEKHTPPAYAFRVEKPAEKSPEKSPEKVEEKRLEKHPEFVERFEKGEDGTIQTVFVNERKVDNTLTKAEVFALKKAGLDLSVAATVKREKVKPVGDRALSNKAISDKYHVPGKRDGFSTRNVAKIAKIVAPSVGGGA